MTHGSLFSGIGGFDLAAQWMGWENKFHCELNEYNSQLLNKRFPESESFKDITKTDFKKYANRIDIITGGFPCQPYSIAGKRKGKEDERHLWPEMLRAIQEIKPRWIVGENVRGIINWNGGLVFHEVQLEMENEGYKIFPCLLPACGVNAEHERYRTWVIAYNDKNSGIQDNGQTFAHNQKRNSKSNREIGKTVHDEFGGYFEVQNWNTGLELIEPKLCRNFDGIPNALDRLESLGNAIVPQEAYQIFKAIQMYETIIND